MATIHAEWPDLYKALFGRRLAVEDITTWQELLDKDFPPRGVDSVPGWTTEELKAALCLLAEERRKRGIAGEVPQYPVVKSAIIKARYEARRPPEQAITSCPWCRQTGWIAHRPGLPAEFTAEQWLHGYSVSVPCVCVAGDNAATRLLASVRPHEWHEAGTDEQSRRDQLRKAGFQAIEQARRADRLDRGDATRSKECTK